MNLEKMMLKDGWKKTALVNDGVEYIEFHKNGFVIDIDDIFKLDKSGDKKWKYRDVNIAVKKHQEVKLLESLRNIAVKLIEIIFGERKVED